MNFSSLHANAFLLTNPPFHVMISYDKSLERRLSSMKPNIRLNEDAELVARIKEGLKAKGG